MNKIMKLFAVVLLFVVSPSLVNAMEALAVESGVVREAAAGSGNIHELARGIIERVKKISRDRQRMARATRGARGDILESCKRQLISEIDLLDLCIRDGRATECAMTLALEAISEETDALRAAVTRLNNQQK